jgi:hypothetical protein
VVAVAAAAPLGWSALRAHPAEATRVFLALAAPGAVYVLARMLDGHGGTPRPAVSLLVLATSLLVARGRLVRWRRTWLSAAVSLGVTAGVVTAMRAAYRHYGFDLPIGPGDGSWTAWLWPRLAAGVAVEAWLRGAVFGAALPLGGWPLALALSTALGVLLSAGQTPEVVLWSLFAGVAFGAIRLWTRDAAGLGPARGLGDAVVMGLAELR